MNNTTTNQTYAYLVYLGNNQTSSTTGGSQQFTELLNQAERKVEYPGFKDAYIVWSRHDLNHWYKAFQSGGFMQSVTTPVGAMTPFILPIDVNAITGLQGQGVALPSFLQGLAYPRAA